MLNKKFIARLEIILMFLGIVAFSYNLSPVPIIPRVSAMAIPSSCCENPPTGAACRMVTDSQECGTGVLNLGASCDYSAGCVRGCCYNEARGIYTPNVLQKDCKETFLRGDTTCNTLSGSVTGCCILGDYDTSMTTRKQCELKTPREQTLNWSSSIREVQCLLLQTSRNDGACLTPSEDGINNCRMTTQQDCITITGRESSFFAGYLCTARGLNTTCKKTTNTNCFDEKDEVYFLDTCGNKANIYDASKVNDLAYWDKIVKKNNSCGYLSTTGNANSASCGNCNRFSGGICSPEAETLVNPSYGNYACKQTSCTYKGRTYKNAESWCEYESKAGDGRDVVGARHFRYVCNYGDIDIVKCSDYRNQLCVEQDTIDPNDASKKFSWGQCTDNDWMSCLGANNVEGDMTSCKEISNCRISTVAMGNFSKNFCLPRVAPGFNVQSEEEVSTFTSVCSYGSATCVVRYKCTYDCYGDLQGCACVENCECQEQDFVDKMNKVCASVGDCGQKFNTQEKFTKNFKVSGNTTIKNISEAALAELRDYVTPVEGEYLFPSNLSDLDISNLIANLGYTLGTNDARPGDTTEDEDTDYTEYLWPVGVAIIASIIGNSVFGTTIIDSNVPSVIWDSDAWLGGRVWEGFMGTLIGAGVGWWLGSYVSDWFGYAAGSDAAIATQIGTALIGASIGNAFGTGAWFNGNTYIVLAGLIAIGVSFFLDDDGDCDDQYAYYYQNVIFECKPWTAPSGGEDCEECNNNPFRPCSEYACNSLGASCEILNVGTDHEMCANAHEGDMVAPDIEQTAEDDRLIYSLSGNNIQISGRSGGCLDPFMVYMLGIKTDEPSQCRYDFQRKEIFEDLGYEFGSGYIYNHVARVQIPSTQSIPDWDGKLTLYVRCRDVQNNLAPVGDFYKIQMCVNPERDLRAPIVTPLPTNGSYIKMNATQQQIIVYTNEPADCKWSKEIRSYSMMENRLTCNNQITQGTILGWACRTTLPITSSKNTFYIRCADQPTQRNESLRNPNQVSTELTLLKASTPLAITGIAPQGEFETTSVLTMVSLNALTSGGAGNTSCKYSFTSYENMIPVFFDNGDSHEQVFDRGLAPGNYKIYVECTDKATDKVRGETTFQIVYDASATKISRAYVKEGVLKIFSVKDRECKYSTDQTVKCNFDYNEGVQMGVSKQHTISMIKGQEYYIKCPNKFGDVPVGCTEVVSVV